MSYEILYTSAPQGLQPGARGFCVVQMSEGMPPVLLERLESLSAYRQAYSAHDERAAQNPVAFSHLVLTLSGRKYHVLSRVADAGRDYTGRSNKLAHHVALLPNERVKENPAWALQGGLCLASWDNQTRLIEHARTPREIPRPPRGCDVWSQLAGDAGWAGVLAESALDPRPRPAHVIFQPGWNVLPLADEALALLPPAQQWDVTFSTYFTGLPAGVECRWRFLLDDSPEAAAVRKDRSALVIDLARGVGAPRGGALVAAAKGGMQFAEARPSPAAYTAVPAAPTSPAARGGRPLVVASPAAASRVDPMAASTATLEAEPEGYDLGGNGPTRGVPPALFTGQTQAGPPSLKPSRPPGRTRIAGINIPTGVGIAILLSVMALGLLGGMVVMSLGRSSDPDRGPGVNRENGKAGADASLPPQLDRRSRNQVTTAPPDGGKPDGGERSTTIHRAPDETSNRSHRRPENGLNEETASNGDPMQDVTASRNIGGSSRWSTDNSGKVHLTGPTPKSSLREASGDEIIAISHHLHVYHKDVPEPATPTEGLKVKGGKQLWVLPGNVALVHLKDGGHDIEAKVIGGSWIEFGQADELLIYYGRVVLGSKPEGARINLSWPKKRLPGDGVDRRSAFLDWRNHVFELHGLEDKPLGVEVWYSRDFEADTRLRIAGRPAIDPLPDGAEFIPDEQPQQWLTIDSVEREVAEQLARALSVGDPREKWLLARERTAKRICGIVEDSQQAPDLRAFAARCTLCLQYIREATDLMDEIYWHFREKKSDARWEKRHENDLRREFRAVILRDARDEHWIRNRIRHILSQSLNHKGDEFIKGKQQKFVDWVLESDD